MKSLPFLFVLFLALLISAACSPTKKGGSNANGQVQTSQTPGVADGYQTLADWLRRQPGVRITGSGDDLTVVIRSSDNVTGGVESLFVIDKNTATNYSQASRMVDVNDIQSVRVLKGVEAQAAYGLMGANGVIVIKTKGGN